MKVRTLSALLGIAVGAPLLALVLLGEGRGTAVAAAPGTDVAAPAAEGERRIAVVTDPEKLGRAPGEPLEAERHHARLSLETVEHLSRHHFVRRAIDDELSEQVFDKYIEALDPQRLYFLAGDLRAFDRWRHDLDEALRSGDLEPAFDIFNRYEARLRERLEYSLALVEDGLGALDFDRNEYFEVDRADAPWPADLAEQDDLWRKRLKATVLDMRLNDRDDEEIAELLTKRYRNRLERLGQTRSEDAFQVYMNAVTASFDPHTQYFSPRTSENFNINMRLSLEGIGAVLRTEDEYTKVVRLVPAGPADKTGQLQPEDTITAVGQGTEGPLVDVVGWRLDDVVDLIRGEKNTVVRLEITPEAGGERRVIAIERNTVKLEEQSAQARAVEIDRDGRRYRLGVIDIPTFYIDFQALQRGDPQYKSTTRDVRRLIGELRAEGELDALIIDLRSNGGGSLQEANELIGLFIPYGPTVQTVNARRKRQVHSDRDHGTAWDGPMMVMVNRLSASASEIFAGAMQDYQRALIVGGQTFGKGTVQQLVQLSRGAQLKLTQSKFYRVSGQSTQHQGVIPDIAFPTLYDHDAIGESALEDALPWDRIKPAVYSRAGDLEALLPRLITEHQRRVSDDPDFEYLRGLLALNREQSDRETIPLNEAERRARAEAFDAKRLALENRLRLARGEEPVDSLDDLDASERGEARLAATDPPVPADSGSVVEDPVDGEGNPDGPEGAATLEDDALLREAGEIAVDLVTMLRSEQVAGVQVSASR